jgi:hypothetical protein
MSVAEVKGHRGETSKEVATGTSRDIQSTVKELIKRLIAEDREAQDGGSANMFPAVLDAAHRWNEDVTAYLATSSLSESDQKLFRGYYYDTMMNETFGELRHQFVERTKGFADSDE